MMVNTVSILGVDDSVSPTDLVDISRMYPFVEWGFFLCSNHDLGPGYPSDRWLNELLRYSDKLRLRGVLQGRWERDILEGNLSLRNECPKIWEALHRVQVDIRKGYGNILETLQLISDKEVILESNKPNSIITGIHLDTHLLLPKSLAFVCPEYCGYSLSESDVDLVLSIPSREESCWISVDGFRQGDSLDLFRVEHFLDQVEDKITNDSWFRALLQVDEIKKRFSDHSKRA